MDRGTYFSGAGPASGRALAHESKPVKTPWSSRAAWTPDPAAPTTFWQMLTGVGHEAMPEFELSPRQIADFIGYLKTLEPQE